MTMRVKQILARAFGIQKKTGGNHALFRDNLSDNYSKKPVKHKVMYSVFLPN